MCHGQILEQAIRRARKAHKCDDCRTEIRPGERYERQAQVNDGDFVTYVMCRRCAIKNAAFWELQGYDQDACYFDRNEALREDARGAWRSVLSVFRKARARMFKPHAARAAVEKSCAEGADPARSEGPERKAGGA